MGNIKNNSFLNKYIYLTFFFMIISFVQIIIGGFSKPFIKKILFEPLPIERLEFLNNKFCHQIEIKAEYKNSIVELLCLTIKSRIK